MKTVNIFTSNVTGKTLIIEKSETKKAVRNTLAAYMPTLEAEYQIVIKSPDRRARNVANAAKGKYKTVADVIAACFPVQTKEGVLCCKKTVNEKKVWAEKKLTAAAARGIVRDALNNFTKYVGKPEVKHVTIGAEVEK